MSDTKYINAIKEAVSEADQTVLFGNQDSTKLVEACIDYLKFSGYKVTKPAKCVYAINSIDELISFFYILVDVKHPEYVNAHRNVAENRAIAKRFVQSRMEASNINKKEAFNECAEIIDTVFKYEAEFKFKYDISFRLFGQNKLGWVTDKAIQIINQKRESNGEDALEKKRQDMIDTQDTSDLGFDLDEILDII